MPVRVVVFDYDGTLADSNAIKRDAYRPLFPPGPEVDGRLAAAWAAHPDGTRYDMIRAMLRQSSSPPEAIELEREVQRLAEQYDRIATEGAAACPERPGAGALLERLARRYPLYLLSATPQSSIERIVARRGWARFFKTVRGLPCDKAAELVAFAHGEGAATAEVLMVGDGDGDRRAATRARAQFLYLAPDTGVGAVDAYLRAADRQEGILS